MRTHKIVEEAKLSQRALQRRKARDFPLIELLFQRPEQAFDAPVVPSACPPSIFDIRRAEFFLFLISPQSPCHRFVVESTSFLCISVIEPLTRHHFLPLVIRLAEHCPGQLILSAHLFLISFCAPFQRRK